MKIAIVTGATGGLGHEFIREVLKENIDEIWAVARNENRLDNLKAEFGVILKISVIFQDCSNLSKPRNPKFDC